MWTSTSQRYIKNGGRHLVPMVPMMWKFPTELWFLWGWLVFGGWDFISALVGDENL